MTDYSNLRIGETIICNTDGVNCITLGKEYMIVDIIYDDPYFGECWVTIIDDIGLLDDYLLDYFINIAIKRNDVIDNILN